MTPLPAVPGVVKVQFQWTVGTNTRCWSHFFAEYDMSAPTGPQLDTFAAAVKTLYDTNLKSLARPDVVLTHVFAEDLSTNATPQGVWAGSVTGTRSSGPLPAEVAALINLKISRRYRGGKPRMYMPFGNQVDINNAQSWTSAFTTAVNTGWTNFHSGLIGTVVGSGHVIDQVSISYFSGHAARATPFIDGVLSWSCNSLPASQRRRMGRAG